jgi:ferredoxin-NADP reductase
MTDDMMNLRSLVEKNADADLLREMISFAAEKLKALEVGAKTGAGYGEKNGFRLERFSSCKVRLFVSGVAITPWQNNSKEAARRSGSVCGR